MKKLKVVVFAVSVVAVGGGLFAAPAPCKGGTSGCGGECKEVYVGYFVWRTPPCASAGVIGGYHNCPCT